MWRFKIGRIPLVLFAVVSIFYLFNRFNYLYLNPPNDGGSAKINGKIAALDYIYQDASDKQFGLLIFTPPVNTYAYDYLIWWYAQRKYNYLPYSEKKGLVYLLIEPDWGKIWSYQGWLDTVIIDGQILDTKTLPSGLIVQKRSFDKF